MKRPYIYSLFITIATVSVIYGSSARPKAETALGESDQQQDVSNSKFVYGKGKVARSMKLGDSSVVYLVGDVVFYHNGAVITCDSAIRYSPTLVAGFNNVIINKDNTYIYGDKIDYSGETNIANVYSPIIKTVDKDVTMYTYNMSFNTQDNIGHYTGGGTLYQGDNHLESESGFYYADKRELLGVDNVEMQSPDYNLISDSVWYNMDTEIASFKTRSYIWNKADEFLTAVRGNYDRHNERYTFTDSSYIMTASQELWADTIVYEQTLQNALLIRNVQIVDTVQRAMAFGDFVQYWGDEQRAVLTREPSMVSYSEGEDTLYMRSDSILIFSERRVDSVSLDSIAAQLSDTVSVADIQLQQDSVEIGSREVETVASDKPLTKKELRAEAKRHKREEKEANIKQKIAEREAKRKEKVSDNEEHDHDHDHSHDDTLHIEPLPDLVRTGVDTAARSEADTMLRTVFAYKNVKIFRNDFQAVCDSLVGFSADSTLHMYIEPLLWNENNQISSTVIDIFTKDKAVDRAHFVGDPIMCSQVDSTRFNQVKGKRMESFFRNGSIYQTDVNGNAQTYYYMEDNDSLGRYIVGFFAIECANISFRFVGGELDDIAYFGASIYDIYPMDKIPDTQSQTLPGFKWQIERKPSKEDVFTRFIRPSQRAMYMGISKPMFPLSNQIDILKKRLIGEGAWLDRTDTLTPEAVEFINSRPSDAVSQ